MTDKEKLDLINNKIRILEESKIKPLPKKQKTSFEIFLEERAKRLNYLSEDKRKEIELKISIFVTKTFKDIKNSKEEHFFSYEPFLEHPLIKKYFMMYCFTGDRNIGKTTSSKKYASKVVANGKKFMMLRNIDDEVEQQANSDEEHWWPSNAFFRGGTSKMPNVENINEEIVGYYRAVNTIGKFKSIEFPDVWLAIYEEFNSEVRMQKGRFRRFSEFITTLQRHNSEMRLILQANYVNQDDEMLQKLGVGLEEISPTKLVIFNWITGALIVFIPKGIYKSTSNDEEKERKYLGKGLALNDHETWVKQFGGRFVSHRRTNIINSTNIVAIKDVMYNMCFSPVSNSDITLTMYRAYDKKNNLINYFTQQMGENEAPTLVFDNFSELKNINAIRLESDMLESLIIAWKNNEIKTDSSDTYDLIIRVLSNAKKVIDNSGFFIGEIENLV